MELLYLWINKSDNNCFHNQQLNLSPEFEISVDNAINPTEININNSNKVNIFKYKIKKLSNITAVVGANGSGKTTLFSYIAHNDCMRIKTLGEGYERHDAEKLELNRSIHVYLKNDEILIYHNLNDYLKVQNCTSKKFEILKYDENSRQLLADIHAQTIIYITNSNYISERFNGYSRFTNTNIINLTPSSLNEISRVFYNSLLDIPLFNNKKNIEKNFAKFILKSRNAITFQQILDIIYYKYVIENIPSSKFYGIIESTLKTLHISCDYIIQKIIIQKGQNIESHLDDKIRNFERFYDIRKYISYNIANMLYFNILFELYYYNDDFELPPLTDPNNIYNDILKANTVQNKKYLKYLYEIKELKELLDKCPVIDSLIDNENDLAIKYDKIIDYSSNKLIYEKFLSYISKLFYSKDSYVLRYIIIGNLEMSSGERALQNLFSWIIMIPIFDKILNVKSKLDNRKLLLLIDEIDLYAHPEWQRKLINSLLTKIQILDYAEIQIVLSSHSPFILSDFPKDNIIYISNDEKTGESYISKNVSHKETFGANLYTLLNDAFFLNEGAVGEFSRNTILEIYNEIKDKNMRHDNAYYEYLINSIGDKIIRNELMRIYNVQAAFERTPQIKNQENTDLRLRQLKEQLNHTIQSINNILGEGND